MLYYLNETLSARLEIPSINARVHHLDVPMYLLNEANTKLHEFRKESLRQDLKKQLKIASSKMIMEQIAKSKTMQEQFSRFLSLSFNAV
ncbi:MAG: hypothetical protein IPK55_11015 [Streptococcus sp.]|nr:hypothetical protein [Streptococcus sp.]